MAYGFEFTAKSGKRFQLDAIQPYVFLQSVDITTIGTKSYRYPSLARIAEVRATCEYNESARDGGKATSWSTSYNSSTGTIYIKTAGALGSGNWSHVRFSIWARFN